MENKNCVIIIQESFKESAISDLKTFLTLLASVGVGVLLESQAMQWLGGIMWVIWILCRTHNVGKRLNPQQAADKLKDEYGVVAKNDVDLTP